jgi:hypothetical protein
LNYFSYFSEIEDTFIRRRGKHLMLSPIDWALIESWKERGVPLHVALRAIEHAFDSHESKKRKRSVKSLLYCQEEVEAQYAEWLETRVGGHEESPASEVSGSADSSPFSREAVLAHLARSRDRLATLARERMQSDELTEALSRAANLLAEIREDYETSIQPDTRRLEDSLTGLDRLLDNAITVTISPDDLESAEQAVESQIKPYKRHMDKTAYQQTRDNLLRRRLREHFDLPRLSLFYL